MKIYVSMKSIGKRKNVISKQCVQLPIPPGSLRILLSEVIKLNIQQMQGKQAEKHLVSYLTDSQINSQASNGKVGFGNIYNENQPDLTEAIQTAIQAFEDGLFRVFVNNEEIEALDASLEIAEGDEVVFIRLTMLAGRMW